MKTSIILLLIVWAGMMGCSEDEVDPKIPGFPRSQIKTTYEILYPTNLMITLRDHSTNISIVAGENRVFRTESVYDRTPNAIDDELYETIVFEINPELSEFSFTDQEIRRLNAYYTWSAQFHPPEPEAIDQGTIEGVRLGERTWMVKIDIAVHDWNGKKNLKVATIYEEAYLRFIFI